MSQAVEGEEAVGTAGNTRRTRRRRRSSQLSEVTSADTEEEGSASPRPPSGLAVPTLSGSGTDHSTTRSRRRRRQRYEQRRAGTTVGGRRSSIHSDRDAGTGTGTDTYEDSLESSHDSLVLSKPPLADVGSAVIASGMSMGVLSVRSGSRPGSGRPRSGMVSRRSRRTSSSRGRRVSSARRGLRLKCHYQGHIRVVALTTQQGETSFRSLQQRLAADYGFDVALKYEDQDGDLITLASQNDLNELISLESGTVTVHVTEVSSAVDVSRVLQSPTPATSRSSVQLHPLEDQPVPPTTSAMPHPIHGHGRATPTARGPRGERHMHLLPLSRSRAETPSVPKKMRWQRGQIIGQGAYGTVYLGLNLDTGELMAIKQLDTNALSRKEMMSLENEVNMMRGMYHENIVRYLGTDRADDTLSIFMEYVPGGSIRQLLERFGSFDESVRHAQGGMLL